IELTEPEEHACHQCRPQRETEYQPSALILNVPQQPEDKPEYGTTRDRRNQQTCSPRCLVPNGNRPEDHPQKDAGVDQRVALQHQEQNECRYSAFDPVPLAELGYCSDPQANRQTAEREEQHQSGLPPIRLLQSDEQKQAEVDALQNIFDLRPTHGV